MNISTLNIMGNNRFSQTKNFLFGIGFGAFLLVMFQPSHLRGAEADPSIVMQGEVPTLVLPDSLKRFIATQFPDLRVPTKSDMTGAWAVYKKKKTVPYACLGHFDDQHQTDIAIILLGRKEWRVLAFHPLVKGQYAVLPLEDYPGTTQDFTRAYAPQQFSLSTVKAGQSLVIEGKKIPETEHPHDTVAFFSLKDPQTGILYQWMPKGDSDKPEYQYGLYIASVFGALSD